ncbi:4Fe-4S dicluster domain-containing protein [soil metagenome]
MWDNLLNLFVKAVSVQPDYTKEHCLAYKQSVSACSICRDTCPHQAISFVRGKEVAIDDVDCTGCGLCVQACPSQALESKVSYQPGAPLKCSQVKGGAQSVQCLARLMPSDLLRLAGRKDSVTLVRADCGDCKIGNAAVPLAVELLQAEAQDLAALRGRDFAIETVVAERYDAVDNPDPVSRRELLRGGWRGLQTSAADALAPFDPGGENDASLPHEMQRQYRLIERSVPEEDGVVPWILPRVADGCIMCPVCTNVCPTKAFGRDFDPPDLEGTALLLEPDRCNGCSACVTACPVKVITLDEQVTWGELSGGKEIAYYKDPQAPKTDGFAR